MKTKVILTGLLACIGITAQAKDAKNEEPKDKAIIQAFGNFHSGFGADNDNRGFELERSYLGYEYKLTNDLCSKNDWNIAKDEQTAMLGAQFKLSKYVKIAPNFRMNRPKKMKTKDSCHAYINCYFGL